MVSEQSEKAVKRWFFAERKASSKYVSDMSVSVRETGLSPWWRVIIYTLLVVWGYGPAAVLFWTFESGLAETPLGLGILALTAVIVVPWTLLAVIVTLRPAPKAIWKYVGPPRTCETCGTRHRHTHRLYHVIRDPGPSLVSTRNIYHFCSRDCREEYERENLSGSQPSLQTERDQDHWNAIAEREILSEDYDPQ